ncbi:MAG: crossover junction endodeoxyribonuclease RuvC [Candidatus Paceibacterota bacterium]
MRVIAVDPGYDRMGVAVLEHTDNKEHLLHSECIETDRTADIPERLTTIGIRFSELLSTYTPDCLAIETLFFNQNQKTAIAVAEARGVVLFLAKQRGCSVREFGPQEVKVAVTGYGKSDKTAVFDMLHRLVPDIPKKAHDDEYDAIAVGVTALAHHR